MGSLHRVICILLMSDVRNILGDNNTFNLFILYAFVIALQNSYAIMIYKMGIMDPLVVFPLKYEKKSSSDPLIRIQILVVEIHLNIRLMH